MLVECLAPNSVLLSVFRGMIQFTDTIQNIVIVPSLPAAPSVLTSVSVLQQTDEAMTGVGRGGRCST